MAVATNEMNAFIQELEMLRNGLEEQMNQTPGASLVERQFIKDLQGLKHETAHDIRSGKYGTFHFGDRSIPPEKRFQVVTMLKALVYPETKVCDHVASRIPQLPDLDLKARASQQVIDEVKHARVLREMLTRWGEDPQEMYLEPLPEIEDVFAYVGSVETVEEFFTANFMCEGLFLPSHLQVMSELDPDAFGEYIESTVADEGSHVALARDVILRYATTPEARERCRRVAAEVTELFVRGLQAKVKKLNSEGTEPAPLIA